MEDKERKRLLKRVYKENERARAREAMVLEEDALEELLDHLDDRLADEGCDHSLRLTRTWAEARGIDADDLAKSLSHFGGYCDCEVLANVEPEEIL